MPETWARHRPEPLFHERCWGCDAEVATSEVLGGFDAAGRAVAVRDPYGDEMVVSQGRDRVVIDSHGAIVATTVLDDTNRPVATVYAEDDDERYTYDATGQLVAISASGAWLRSGRSGWRWDRGGSVSVENDAAGPVRLIGQFGEVVWDRDEPIDEHARGRDADALANVCVEIMRAAAAELDGPVEVFTLAITYVGQGSVYPTLWFGREDERRATKRTGEEYALALFYPEGTGLAQLEPDDYDHDRDTRMMRTAARAVDGDPHRVVLTEVARRTLARTWPAEIVRADDFVAFIAEHDEGFAPKVASIREVNSPDRIARWEAALPPGTPLSEDEAR